MFTKGEVVATERDETVDGPGAEERRLTLSRAWRGGAATEELLPQRADDDRKYKIMDWKVAQKAAKAGDWSAEGMKARVSPPAKVSSAASSASSGGRRRRR